MAKSPMIAQRRNLFLYQGFDEAVIETSHSTNGHTPDQVAARQSFEMRLCALFMPPASRILISRTFIEESAATRICVDKNRALCEQGFFKLLTNTLDAYREREKKQYNYRNVRGLVKYHMAYYDPNRGIADYSSFEIEPKDFETGKLAHSLWIDIGRGKSVHFMVEPEFDDWINRIKDSDTGNSTWEATTASLYTSGIPHEMFDDLHNLSFTTYADSHRHNGIGIVVGSSIAQKLFTGEMQPGDFNLEPFRDFCLHHELHPLIPTASPEEIMSARRVLTNDVALVKKDGTRAVLNDQLAEKVRKLLTETRSMRKPSIIPFGTRRFKVALTFPGTHRNYVEQVYGGLLQTFSVDDVFYDFKFQAELAGPNLDLKLRSVYRNQSDLLVVLIAPSYQESDWCGLEWRVIRELIMARTKDDQIMFVFLEEMTVEEFPDGLSQLDGRISASNHTVEDVCEMIDRRHKLLGSV